MTNADHQINPHYAEIKKLRDEVARLNSVAKTIIPQRDKSRDEVKHKDGVIKQQAHQLMLNRKEIARLTQERDEARTALKRWQYYGCPDCGGDCSAANPPVTCCIMRETDAALKGGKP